MAVRPAKTQISLGICPVWSESSLSAWRKLGSLATHWAHSKDSDQTGQMPRLIWVFAGRTLILLVLSCRGSFFMFFEKVVVVKYIYHRTCKQWCNMFYAYVYKWSYYLISAHALIFNLSYNVAVIQWLTSCHKNRMTTRYITLGYWRVTSWCHPWQRFLLK